MSLELFACPPLRAKLTEATCARNRERAEASARSQRGTVRHGTAMMLSDCIGCPGVRAFGPPVETVEREGREQDQPRGTRARRIRASRRRWARNENARQTLQAAPGR